ncbi:MAG: AAA family ATPase [Caldilineaceae bacterium]
MKLKELRISNFQCFGNESAKISFDDSTTIIIGPNGSGKTAILQALARMFSTNPALRRIRKEDFHVPHNEKDIPDERHLTIEADFSLPEAYEESTDTNIIPPCFNHMRLHDDCQQVTIRYLLEATMGVDGDIEEGLFYVIGAEPDGEVKKKRVSRAERNHIAVYYLPAKRDPNEQIQTSTTSLLGRIIRSVDWSEQDERLSEMASDMRSLISDNSAMKNTNSKLSSEWKELHKGSHFYEANVIFGIETSEELRKNVSVEFSPAHLSKTVDYSLLSDGQKSLLYLSLVTTFIEIGRIAMNAQAETNQRIDVNKLNPPIYSLVAVEEPENSLSPHYLGRINSLLKKISAQGDAQAIVTTHSPAMLRRVPPEQIRHTRIGVDRVASVKEINMPPQSEMDAYKYIREGILSNPEVYFSRFVVLGEGASEDIVLPKLFEAEGLPFDENGITIAQLGGRYVNYMWKLLNDLEIPHATLLDLDLSRYQGGWGRIKYAVDQLARIGKIVGDSPNIPKWDEENPLEIRQDTGGLLGLLQNNGIFFSQPLDLDFSMLQKYPDAYEIDVGVLCDPDESSFVSVLGKSYKHSEWYNDDDKKLFAAYHRLFKIGSKPAKHISALSKLELERISKHMPNSYRQLIARVRASLNEAYE